MTENDIGQCKDALRREMFRRRAEASEAASREAPADLAQRVLAHLEAVGVAVAGWVTSAFLPIRTEIETRPTIAALHEAGLAIALPTIEGDDPDLVFRSYTPGDALVKGAFDVEEPMTAQPVVQPRTLLVPLLAFDAQGYRLGYGGGYYDRAIARLSQGGPVATVGLAYDAQEVDDVPREAHDLALDAIVTPTRTLLCNDGTPLQSRVERSV
ncbi:MAG: 5-formyltetrahydrofolate cyclo-ligase [Pseudomonadota bacterium]